MKILQILAFSLFTLLYMGCDANQTAENEDDSLLKKMNDLGMKADSSAKSKDGLPFALGYVNDFDSLLSEEQVVLFDGIIRSFEQKTGNVIVICSTKDYGLYPDINSYAQALFKKWGIGKEGLDNGLLLLVSKQKQEVRLLTGLGTEKILTDKICQTIVDKAMVPRFLENDYPKGIYDGLQEIIKQWK